MTQETDRVAILTVIPAELAAARRALGLNDDPDETREGSHYWTKTTPNGIPIVLGCIGSSGNYDSGTAASDIIHEFRPRLLILVGIAAGIRGKVKIGQAIFSDRIVPYESAALTTEEGEQPRHDNIRLEHAIEQDVTAYMSGDVASRIAVIFEETGGQFPRPVNLSQRDEYSRHVSSQLIATISTVASGEKLFRDPTRLLAVRGKKHGRIEVAEMEATGIAVACRRYGVPWLVIRGISDFGDSLKDDRFHTFASNIASAALADFLRRGLRSTSTVGSGNRSKNPIIRRNGDTTSSSKGSPLASSKAWREYVEALRSTLDWADIAPLAGPRVDQPFVQVTPLFVDLVLREWHIRSIAKINDHIRAGLSVMRQTIRAMAASADESADNAEFQIELNEDDDFFLLEHGYSITADPSNTARKIRSAARTAEVEDQVSDIETLVRGTATLEEITRFINDQFPRFPPTLLDEVIRQFRQARDETPEFLSSRLLNERDRRFVILGGPGAGKSTICKFLSLSMITTLLAESEDDAQHRKVPFFAAARELPAGELKQQGLMKHVCDVLSAKFGIDQEDVIAVLRNGDAVLFIDGMDEVAGAEERIQLRNEILATAGRFPELTIVVTNRLVGYSDCQLPRESFRHLQIAQLSGEQIESYVHKWYGQQQEETRHATELSEVLADNPNIAVLARTPLLLTIMCLVHRLDGVLPSDRAILYERCCSVMIDRWDRFRGIKGSALPAHLIRRRLEMIAFWLHEESSVRDQVKIVPSKDLLRVTKEFLLEREFSDDDDAQREATLFLEYVRRRTGLLVEKGEEWFAFSHRTFQEFLAANDMIRRWASSPEDLWTVVRSHLLDPNWLEVIQLLMSQLARTHEVVADTLVMKILKEGRRLLKRGKKLGYARCVGALVGTLRDNTTYGAKTNELILTELVAAKENVESLEDEYEVLLDHLVNAGDYLLLPRTRARNPRAS